VQNRTGFSLITKSLPLLLLLPEFSQDISKAKLYVNVNAPDGIRLHILLRYGQARTPLPPAEPATAERNKSRSVIHAAFKKECKEAIHMVCRQSGPGFLPVPPGFDLRFCQEVLVTIRMQEA